MTTPQVDEELRLLCASPFKAEHNRKYEDAYRLHGQAIHRLGMLVNDTSLKDAHRKEVAQTTINIHQQRQQALRPVLNGTGEPPSELPTTLSVAEELIRQRQISNDMTTLYLWKNNPSLRANPGENQKHLLQVPVPFYVPTLDLKLPDTIYRIHKGCKGGFFASRRLQYYDINDASDKQTLYKLQAFRYPNTQMPFASLHRMAEFANSCIVVQIAPIKTKESYGLVSTGSIESAMTGRPLKLISDFWGSIDESTDRLEKMGWTPRRFSYGGRRFVWKQEGKDDWNIETLYEVEKEWPKPGSRTGKKEDKTFERRLVWGEYKNKNQIGTIHFAGGIDQVFREYLLASQLTKFMVMRGWSG